MIGDIWTFLLVLSGCFFFFAGTIGLLRFPDAHTRLHALTKADTLGLGLVVIGLLPQVGWSAVLKLLAIWVMALLAAAGAAHVVARGALRLQGGEGEG